MLWRLLERNGRAGKNGGLFSTASPCKKKPMQERNYPLKSHYHGQIQGQQIRLWLGCSSQWGCELQHSMEWAEPGWWVWGLCCLSEGWAASTGSVLRTRIFHGNVCRLQFSTNIVKAQRQCVIAQKHCAQQLWVFIYENNTVWFQGELIKLHKRFTSPFCSCNNAFSTSSDPFLYSNRAACAGLSFGL